MSSLTPCAGSRLLLPLLLSAFIAKSTAQPNAVLSYNSPLCAGAPVLTLFESGGSATAWNWTGPAGFSSTQQNPVIPNPVQVNAGTYHVTVTDQQGLTATGDIKVAIHQPSMIVCNDQVIISPGPQGEITILPQTVLQGAYDFDFYAVEVYSNTGQNLGNMLDCSFVGQTLVYRVFDICNGNSCWGTLKVEDKIPPTISCPDVLYSCAIEDFSPDYLQSLGVPNAFPTVTDNCSVADLTYVEQFNDLDCPLPINALAVSSAYLKRTWIAEDAFGNTSTCLQIVYFVRRHLSDVHLPLDTTISCEHPSTDPQFTGAPYITEMGRAYSIYPNTAYCEIQAGYSDEIIEVCDGSHKVKRTWVVAEDCPDTGQPGYLVWEQLIKVMDNKGPAFVCPADISVSIDPFTCCATTDLPDVMLSDNCSRINQLQAYIQTFDVWTGDSTGTYGMDGVLSNFPNNNIWNPDTLGVMGFTPCLPQGAHTVTYRAVDDCGNVSSCTFHLTIQDEVPPVAACDSWTKVAIGDDGKSEVFAETFDDGSYDRCCTSDFYVRRMDGDCSGQPDDFDPSVWFCCSDIGDTVRVVFRAYDCAGNYNDCMVNVVVEDKLRPVCLPPPNITVDCAAFDPSLESYGQATPHDNCCIDTLYSFANYNLFDTICNRGTILRTFRVADCAGNTNQCTQRIVVNYREYYYLKMPDDKIVNSCDGTGNYGEPTFHFVDCELIGVSYEDEIFTVVPEGCYRIDRHWKIIDWCTYNPNGHCVEIPNPDISQTRPFILPGPVISPANTLPPWNPTITYVAPTDPAPTNYSIFWDSSANCYEYKQMILVFDTKDPVIDNCPHSVVPFCDQTNNHSALWNDNSWWDAATSSHNLCEGPADLSLTASDACTKANVRFHYLLFLDLDGDGIQETEINSDNMPPAGMVYYGNVLTSSLTGGALRPFDLRPVPANQKYNFGIYETVTGNKKTAFIRWKTNAELSDPGSPGVIPELPYGKHRVKWIVEDGCTNESLCDYEFAVKDCKKPTVVCINGLSANLPATGEVQLWATDLLQYDDDNCTPPAYLKLAIRKAGTGTGFPVNGQGVPVTGITFDCSEIGTQPVELWAMDLAGNADYCQTYVTVQDNLGVCSNVAQVSGAIKTEDQSGVEDAQITLSGSSLFAPVFNYYQTSDQQGNYNFAAVPVPSDFTLTPAKDDNPTNGVTTYDLVEISKHILGIKPLGSPYKMIAADANHSNSITSFDVVELRKLILGIYPDLPSNSSWRFIDKSYVFPNPLNPFSAPFPENVSVFGLSGNQPASDFVAVKIGDVNGSALAHLQAGGGTRATAPEAYFQVKSTRYGQLTAGDQVLLTIQPEQILQGFQFTLNFKDLEVTDILPGTGMQADQFAWFPDRSALTVSWENGGPATFRLRCKVLATGALEKMLAIGSNITAAEAYPLAIEPVSGGIADGALPTEPSDHPVLKPALRFSLPEHFECYPAQPNPFTDNVLIGFFLPTGGNVVLTIQDAAGRVVWTGKRSFDAGFNSFPVDFHEIEASGLLFYRMESASGAASGKMVRE